MDDPYCWPGSDCLRNLLGLHDPAALTAIESRVVGIRDASLARDALPGEYDLEHLKAFHQHLFQDVYEWAGETRTVDIHKPGATFCHWRFIADQTSQVLHQLARDDLLADLDRTRMVERLAYYHGELNARHPFREGNGRTQRAFLRQLAAAAGWHLEWSGVRSDVNLAASRRSLSSGAHDALIAMIGPIVSRI